MEALAEEVQREVVLLMRAAGGHGDGAIAKEGRERGPERWRGRYSVSWMHGMGDERELVRSFGTVSERWAGIRRFYWRWWRR